MRGAKAGWVLKDVSGVATETCVGPEVPHLARRAVVLPGHPDRTRRVPGALLQAPCFLQDDDPSRISQMIADIRLQGGPADTAAHRGGVPTDFGPWPAILAWGTAEQTLRIGLGPPAGGNPPATGPQPRRHFVLIGLPDSHRGPGPRG